ncbi:hypothetical protein MMC22_004248 [Lobaria immixta]|nr:hypothetical protein [Lobaria immixta]
MAGAYKSEEESSIDLVPQEKKTVNTKSTVPRMSNPLLDLFSQSAPTDTQLKGKSKAIVYNDTTHKKASDEVATYKTLARKCKEKVKLLVQRLVDSKECLINNENLQTKLNNVQTQLTNICMQRKNNVATPTATTIKYKQLQQQVENMQSQLDNACAH